MTPDSGPGFTWTEDGAPYAEAFGDTYFARADGLGETRHVFLAGNGLPERWPVGGPFTIAELGFGTGLNFVETWRQWRASAPRGARLDYVGFELHPLDTRNMRAALGRWAALAARKDQLLRHWPPESPATTWELDPDVTLTLILGDANETLPAWAGAADAWYLDGFAPAKNPELWGAALMRSVAAHTNPAGSFATYTAAGWVRRNLQAAGFDVHRVPGFGRKRHMLVGSRARLPEGGAAQPMGQ